MTSAASETANALSRSDFGARRLFLADSRLAFAAFNYGRKWALGRLFGVSPAQANVLTAVIALTAADATYVTLRRGLRAPFGLTGNDASMAGFALREAAYGLGGPASREVPGFGAVIALSVAAGVGLPAARRAVRSLRAAEHRIRETRIARYRRAIEAVSGLDPRGAPGAQH